MSSLEMKKELYKARHVEATEEEINQIKWYDGQTIRTAIGQELNSYTPVHMARYIATLANGGTLYKLRLIDQVESVSGQDREEKKSEVESQLELKPQNLQAVYKGMLAVTTGSKGTARGVFEDFPIRVAGKTGTAEEGNRDHGWFVSFAPYDNPQIAVVVMLPYADTDTKYATIIARDIIGMYFGIDETYEKASMDNLLVD
jgi:cell division protein FtsI/penicillin-binding protein 2